MNKHTVLLLVLISTIISCGGNEEQSEHQSKLNWKEDLDVQWDAIDGNDDYRVYFFPVSQESFVSEKTSGKHVTDFMYNDSIYELDGEDFWRFVEFVSDSSNFTDGECGTFALNAGFVVHEFETIKGYVDLGCSHSDWGFYPHNPYAQGGAVSDVGFENMTTLLDGIYTKR